MIPNLRFRQRTRKYRHALLIGLLIIFQKSIRILPIFCLRLLSICLVPFACLFAISSSYQIYQNLKVARQYYETQNHYSANWLKKPLFYLLLKIWDRLLFRFFSFLVFQPSQKSSLQHEISTKLNDDQVQTIIASISSISSPQAHIIITAHLGHWEILAMWLAHCHVPVHAVAGGRSDHPLLKFLKSYRLKHGVHTYQRGEIRQILKQLSLGNPMIFLVDLLALSNESSQTHFKSIQFLGKTIYITDLIDRIAKQSNAKKFLFFLGDKGYEIKSLEVSDNAVEMMYQTLEILLAKESVLIDWIWIHKLFKKESIV